eukprot:gnl/MRDRNA2_/MRDRNA2_34729_c0_seq1.p1 gnl/MRDRNA2_/MRDRNA2_34729_c0~~gnl/MRDRNA2_/MRDRNA2_34729_c0_seq1.p1  ORF type:complete len:329 (+),score=87.40 gnl/MRDRNA2_/MRDRNA2_34729_c0_seq1:56-1042(+)
MAGPSTTNPMGARLKSLLESRQRLADANEALVKEAARQREECHEFENLTRELSRECEYFAKTEATNVAPSAEEIESEAAAAKNEADQLRLELDHERRDAAEGRRSIDAESHALRTELEQKRQQLQRIWGASRAMSDSTEADKEELRSLQGRAEDLELRAEDLQASCRQTTAEAQAWQQRHQEAEVVDAASEAHSSAVNDSLRCEHKAYHEEAAELQQALDESNAVCTALKEELRSSKAGVTDRRNVFDRGSQTRYIPVEARLREQLRSLTEELERVTAHRARQSPWWGFCLRPSFGFQRLADQGAPGSTEPERPQSGRTQHAASPLAL